MTALTDRRREIAGIRDEWLGWGLCALPADRVAAEAAVTRIYDLIGHRPPRFVWAESPSAAMALAPPAPLVRGVRVPARQADWPVPYRIANLRSGLRRRLQRRIFGPPPAYVWDPWGHRIGSGGPPAWDLVDREVGNPLGVSLGDSLLFPLRAALVAEAGESPAALAWHGQHEAGWFAAYDAWRRVTGRSFGPADDELLDLWAALARSCGWWWPREEVCVISERPVEAHTEEFPGFERGELRLHRADGPAVRYADGWSLYSWHGTRVPEWVLTDPTPERIAREPNVEVRRCAVERIGWDEYIRAAGLRPVGRAPDPGNPGAELRLYDLPSFAREAPARLLLAVNGSLERDGTRRRYGLRVPARFDDPVAAAGWTYGLTAPQYARLARRT
ncbi:DUF6745 domain-containing protein [Bailinhaonella thermotolerans]|uniref:DUF6745 domain-containing protein n=1 Tax=Bailinhaonella thermotolerans TaxID=1070861 RepID=A0A3A4A4K0_9ACTN|nr:hypothetical protein [Bailinhaonella thermotolerans]RJL22711.1 hypothetical protein D5H75_34520 [Bailinhaonella thermotolerans]